jgi:hypothetical protein
MSNASRHAEPVPPASPEMAEKLAVNRTGRLTPGQRRLVLVGGLVALAFLLCPLAFLVQMIVLAVMEGVSLTSVGSLIFLAFGALFFIVFVGLAGTNVQLFLADAFGRHPVKAARGPLEIHMSERERPELPFSYIVADYSFAPYVQPPDLPMRPGAPYVVYYMAHSRLLLSLAALDAPDADRWTPAFDAENQGHA